MPLSQPIQDNINNFQCGLDGSAKAVLMDSRKVPYNDKVRHLIIGLGGTGVDALLEVKGFVQLTCTGASTVRYLGFDTDSRQLKQKSSPETGAVMLDESTEWKLLDPPDVNKYLVPAKRKLVSDEIDAWIDYDVRPDAKGLGVAGVRQLGRLLLTENINSIQGALRSAVRELMAGQPGDVKLVISLLSGIGGGTGSGTFLDMSYIVYETALSVVPRNKFSMYGYLFLPDINLCRDGIGDVWKENIRRNGYAALKELEYFMNLGAHEESFTISYAGTPPIHVDHKPFDYLHIVGATPFGGMVIKDPYQHARQAVARYILLFVANETTTDSAGMPTQAIESFYGNIDQSINIFGRGVPERSYDYIPIGSASYELPVDQIMLYVAHLLFEKMEAMYNAVVTDEDHMNFRGGLLQLEPYQLAEKLITGINQDWYSERPDWNVLCSPRRNTLLERVAEQEVSSLPSLLSMRRSVLIEQYKEAFDTHIEAWFKDADRGPVFVNHLLTKNATDQLGLLNWFREQIKQCSIAVSKLNDQMSDAMSKARLLLGEKHHKKEVAASFIESVNQYVKCGRYAHAYTEMVTIYSDLLEYVQMRNNAMFDVVTSILMNLRDVFRKDAAILTAGEFTRINGSVHFTWEVITVPMIDGLLREQLDELVPNAQSLVQEFTAMLWEAAQKWSRTNADVTTFVSKFLDSHIAAIAHNTIETYVQNVLAPGQSLDESIHRFLAPRLLEASSPLLPLADGIEKGDARKMISVPDSCPNIALAFEQYVNAHAGELGGEVVVQLSDIRNRIVATSVQSAVPLAAYKDLYMYEDSYTGHAADTPGMHLVDNMKDPRKNPPNERINWRELPPPIPKCFRPDTASAYPSEIRRLEDERRKLFESALLLPCMTLQHVGGKHVLRCFVSQRPAVKLDKLDKDATPKQIGDKIKELKEYLDTGFPGTNEVKSMSVSDVLVNGQYDETKTLDSMRELFITYFELCRRMKEEVDMYHQAKEMLGELNERIDVANQTNTRRQTFINLMLCDTVYRAGLNYKLRTGSDDDYALTENAMNIPQYIAFKAFEAMKDNPRTREKHKALCSGADKAFNSLLNDLDVALQRVSEVKGAFFKPFQKYIETDYMGQITTHGVTPEVYEFYLDALNYLDHLAEQLDI